MIPVSSLHYGILQQANHTDSEYLNETTVPQRDFYINSSVKTVLKWLVSQDETNDTVRRWLQPLIIRDKKLKTSKSGDKFIAVYPEDILKQKAIFAIGKRDGCTDRRLTIRRPTSEKFQKAIKNANANRVWDFEETFAQEASDGLHVYSEPGVTLDVYMDYIRKVANVSYASGAKGGSYIRSDGEKITEDVNLDLEAEFFESAVINLAVLEIKKDYGHIQDYQTQKDFILSIDRI